MIELKNDVLCFTFPEIHPGAQLNIEMQRTLRIPDDGNTYPLPPGLGKFPLRHIDDFAGNLPEVWKQRGGVMMPMYQSEAMWLNFNSNFIHQHDASYPFAIKIAAGKINAVNGKSWNERLDRFEQDYLVAPEQPWLDGYCVEKGIIRQFVAMPLGSGYSAEEQITGSAEFGGIQIKVFPMKLEEFKRLYPAKKRRSADFRRHITEDFDNTYACMAAPAGMGLAAGGTMRQEIYDDCFGLKAWDQESTSRCYVHLANSMVWESITGHSPPSPTITSKTYSKHGLPWFDYYSDQQVLNGSKKLAGLSSVAQLGKQKNEVPLPENESTEPEKLVVIAKKRSKYQVREESF
jgi:hypothetical protein